MTEKTSSARSTATSFENRWDRFKRGVSARLGLNGTAIIQPFRGFRTGGEFWVRGRVIEDPGISTAVHTDSLWNNIRNTFWRYETDEIPGARIEWTFGDQTGEAVTDEEGYFDFRFQPDSADSAEPWQDVHLRLLQADGFELHPLGAAVPVRTPSTEAQYGIISDIDDTIVYTGASNFLKHWRTVVANSAESRQAYDHIAELYDALTSGADGSATNPIFYVSSSPWNLFDLFERFMILNGIPLGPMLLKDFGLDDDKWLTGGHDGHKTKMIERVFEACPDLPFVLIGDSGQRDLDIYTAIARANPDRIRAVIMHDVTPENRDAEALVAMNELKELNIPAIYTDSYEQAEGFLREKNLLG